MFPKAFTLALAVVAFGAGCLAVTIDEEILTRNALIQLFTDRPKLYPTALRLTFHDCITKCDGCVDLSNSHNAGLEPIVTALDRLKTQLGANSTMSRADLWALAGIEAVNMGIDASNEACTENSCQTPNQNTTFRVGRTDCAAAANTSMNRNFPETIWSWTRMLQYFSGDETGFGLGPTELVALFGAHTLGRARLADSGYRGPWVGGEDNTVLRERQFNNKYYQRFFQTGVTWTTFVTPRNLIQWDGSNSTGMNLNVDMSLVWEDPLAECHAAAGTAAQLSTTGSLFEPDRAGCQASPTAGDAQAYANDNAKFIQDFSSVFEKMIQNGYTGLTEPTA